MPNRGRKRDDQQPAMYNTLQALGFYLLSVPLFVSGGLIFRKGLYMGVGEGVLLDGYLGFYLDGILCLISTTFFSLISDVQK